MVRFDLTPAGFHAQVLAPSGAVYIDPYERGNTGIYACYYKRDYLSDYNDFQCLVPENAKADFSKQTITKQILSPGGYLRTYRLACAATAEYTQFQGGTVAAGMAAIVTAINRVSGVFEAELSIRLSLVANNNLLVYTNTSTDPYNNWDTYGLLWQNQSTLTQSSAARITISDMCSGPVEAA